MYLSEKHIFTGGKFMREREKRQTTGLLWVFAVFFVWALFGSAAKVSAGTTYITMTVGEERTLYPDNDDSDYRNRTVVGGGWINCAFGYYEIQTSASLCSYCRIKALKPTSSPVILRLDYYFRELRGTAIYQRTGYVDYHITIRDTGGGSTGGGSTACTHPSYYRTVLKAATCTEEGRVCDECTRCGKEFYRTVSAKGHTMKKTEAAAPTADAEGNIAYWQCSTCGKYFKDAQGKTVISKEDTVVPRRDGDDVSGGGSGSGGNDTSEEDGSDETPGEDGEEDNGETSEEAGGSGASDDETGGGRPGSGEEAQPAKPLIHTVKKMRYAITGKDTVTFTGTAKSKKSLTSLNIGSTVTVDGKKYKITAVADSAFKGCTRLKSVVIGNNVSKIGSNSFAGCRSLTKVVLGKNIKTISAKAFYNCSKLKAITIKSKKLKSVGAGAIKNIHKKAVIKTPQTKSCKKLFTSKTGFRKTMKIKKA